MNPAALAPGLPPDAIAAAAFGTQDTQAGIEAVPVCETQAEAGFINDDLTAITDTVVRHAALVGIDRESDTGIRRTDLQRKSRCREKQGRH